MGRETGGGRGGGGGGGEREGGEGIQQVSKEADENVKTMTCCEDG